MSDHTGPVPGLFPSGEGKAARTNRIYFNVTGSSHGKCCDAIRQLVQGFGDEAKGQELTLRHDEDNEYDTDAVSVLWKGAQLGFVPARWCEHCEKRVLAEDTLCKMCDREPVALNKKVVQLLKDGKVESVKVAWAQAHRDKNPGAAAEIRLKT